MRVAIGIGGDVNVTDRTARDLGYVRPFWYNEIRNSRAFVLSEDTGAVAAQYSYIQLFNPAGSTITVIVRRILAALITTGTLNLRTYNVGLATLSGTGTNLNSGAATGQAQIRKDQNATLFGTLQQSILTLGNTPVQVCDAWSWQLGAGEGILVMPAAQNDRIVATLEWIEL